MRVGEWMMQVDGPLSGGLTSGEIRTEIGRDGDGLGSQCVLMLLSSLRLFITDREKERRR